MTDLSKYRDLGSPLTLPKGEKWPPTKDTTGKSASVVLDWSDVEGHVEAGGNWGLRVGERYIVLDFDTYKSEDAAAAAEQLIDAHDLPPTLQVSSRLATDSLAGHRWYRLPGVHDWSMHSFVGKIKHGGQEVGETVHQHHRYAVMPGSVVEGRTYEARWHGGEGVIADLPMSLYAELVKSPPRQIQPAAPSGEWSADQVEAMRRQQRMSLGAFGKATEGNRDDRAMRAARDIGAVYRMTGDDAARQRQLAKLHEYAVANGADRETVDKFESQARDGYNEPRLLDEPDAPAESWWHDGGHLERCYNRAMLRADSPIATLLAELAYLSAATDHRVVLDPVTDDIPRPCALWVGLYAESGAHKSRTFSRVKADYADLPDVPKPPSLLRAARQGEADHANYPIELVNLARTAAPRIYSPQTGPGAAAEFMLPHKFGTSKQEVKAYYRALAHFDEPNTLFTRVAEEGRLLSVLRTTFYSGLINPGTAKREGRYYLDEGSYVLSLVVNIQPKIMPKFVKLAEDGTFQRMIFADTRIDAELYDAMSQEPTRYATHIADIPKWKPGKVTLDAEAKTELVAMAKWHMGLDRPEFAQWQESWQAMAKQGSPLAGHLDVKLQRLAVMLFRHAGGEQTGKYTKVPYKYFEIAKRIMTNSAAVIAASQMRERIEARKDEERQLAKTTKRASAAEVGKQIAKAQEDIADLADKFTRFVGRDGAWRYWRTLASGRTLGRETCLRLWREAGGAE